MQEILVKYHDDELVRLEKKVVGDWIDLRSAVDITLKAGEFKIIPLGVSMKLPDGYEAHIAPRSSTYKNWKIIQVNGVGVVDNSYSGENDIWGMPVVAMEDTTVHKNDRICQFRIMKRMENVDITEVSHLDGKDRGGFGSTGTK